jgi:imidazolonepropionase-like amidohydrolase
MTHPRHRERQRVLAAAVRREVQVIVRADQQVEAARVRRIRVKDLTVGVLVEDADAGAFLARKLRRSKL